MRRCGVQMMTAVALRMLLNSPAVVGGAVSLWYTRGLCVVCMCGDVTSVLQPTILPRTANWNVLHKQAI